MRRWGRHHTGWREFSFSRRSPLSGRMRAPRAFLASKETPTIMEFPRAFNEERRLGVRRLAPGLRAETRFGEEKARGLRVPASQQARAPHFAAGGRGRHNRCRLIR